MDQSKFIGVVRQFPQVWDRNSSSFREKEVKDAAWEQIGKIMNSSGNACRDIFKSLREKYIREREKQVMFREKYVPWRHLDKLQFLDPYIVLRKQSLNYEEDLQMAEEYKNAFMEDAYPVETDFDKTLIALVRKATPIWDRKSNSYPSKQLKYQLWKNIAQTMNKDMNICMLRWKGLREKYIRQKNKYQEGDGKWELLDDMSFLDKVIQYRRKNSEDSTYRFENLNILRPEINFQHYEASLPDNDGSSIHDSSNDCPNAVKQEQFAYDLQDSSYDSGVTSAPGRKRLASDNSECSIGKKEKLDYIALKTPEQVFGDLVAAMLTKKTERDKNMAMIEIMKILTK